MTRVKRTTVTALAGLVLLAGAALAPTAPTAAEGRTAVSRPQVAGAATLNRPGVVVFSRPRTTSRRVAILREFRDNHRPQFLLALSALREPETGVVRWYRVAVPGRPNGQTGWVRAEALDVRPVTKRLVIDRSARTFELRDRGRLLRRGRVAVGKPGAETPLGLFQVTWKFDPSRDPDWSILGAYAFETSAYSRLSDWPGGGIVGVHGTPWPELLGRAVSHGCIRLHNRDILYLRSRVPLGTPVEIVR
jgi:lipoprotein-anchoring transpeptidase ErfK/SrfK